MVPKSYLVPAAAWVRRAVFMAGGNDADVAAARVILPPYVFDRWAAALSPGLSDYRPAYRAGRPVSFIIDGVLFECGP